MSQFTLDIPTQLHTVEMKEALQYFIQFSYRNPEALEDVMLGMKMMETENESTVPLDTFLS